MEWDGGHEGETWRGRVRMKRMSKGQERRTQNGGERRVDLLFGVHGCCCCMCVCYKYVRRVSERGMKK